MSDQLQERSARRLHVEKMLVKMAVSVFQWVTQFSASVPLVSQEDIVKLILTSARHNLATMEVFARTCHKAINVNVHQVTLE